MQQDHEREAKSNSTDLIIGKQQKKTLSRQQDTFNRLIKRIEKLRAEHVQVNKSLDEKLDFYVKHIYPLEQQINEFNKEIVRLLFFKFNDKKSLSKKERRSLGRIISGILENIFGFETEEPEEEFKKIFEAMEGISYDQAVEDDFDIMKFEMESMFEDFGFVMNLDALHGKMTEEEMIQKTLELENELKQQADQQGQRQEAPKKTKKQLEKEEKEKQKEEIRSKNISTIYKQLAKIFHPDLEQDEDLRLQKEELMKQLTSAYEKKDLHTLLRLELTWIQKEENNPDKLSDEKLAIYNQVLKEQIFELEREINELMMHPRYQALQSLAFFPGSIKNLNLKTVKLDSENVAKEHAATLESLKGSEKQALAEVKQMIREHEIENRQSIQFSKFMR